jgi:hypothetical protein
LNDPRHIFVGFGEHSASLSKDLVPGICQSCHTLLHLIRKGPRQVNSRLEEQGDLLHEAAYGFRYAFARPNLLGRMLPIYSLTITSSGARTVVSAGL